MLLFVLSPGNPEVTDSWLPAVSAAADSKPALGDMPLKAAAGDNSAMEVILEKCGAESGNSLGVDNISSDEVEERLLSESPSFIEATLREPPPPRSSPVILLVANMSVTTLKRHLTSFFCNKKDTELVKGFFTRWNVFKMKARNVVNDIWGI